MTHVLDVDAGETHTVSAGDTERYSSADIDGVVDVDGHLVIEPGVEHGPEADNTFPEDSTFPTDISLPMQIAFRSMEVGNAVILIGILAVSLSIAWILNSKWVGVMFGLSAILLIVSGVFGMGLELFWMSLVLLFVVAVAVAAVGRSSPV